MKPKIHHEEAKPPMPTQEDLMSTQFQDLMKQLHAAAKTYQLEKVSGSLLRLLQLAKMSEKSLGETLPPADMLEANTFWSRVLDTRRLSDVVEKRSARSIYSVVWSAANGIPSPATRAQAGEYCDHVAGVCGRYLSENTAEIRNFSARETRAPPHLRIIRNAEA